MVCTAVITVVTQFLDGREHVVRRAAHPLATRLVHDILEALRDQSGSHLGIGEYASVVTICGFVDLERICSSRLALRLFDAVVDTLRCLPHLEAAAPSLGYFIA